MKRSNNEQVQEFLDDLKTQDKEKFLILQTLREIVFSNHVTTRERIMYGGIMFTLEEDFGGLFVRKDHITFEFSSGISMKDPDKLLEGSGKFRRHLKIRTFSDIKAKKVDFFVKQSLENN